MDESPETKAIRQRMEDVRCDLDEDVQEIVESARDLGQWRSYVKSYPWVCLGAAMAVGYWVVPRRPRAPQSGNQGQGGFVHPTARVGTTPAPPQSNVRGMLLAFAGNLLMRGAAAFVEQQAGKLFANQAAKSTQDDPS